MQEFFDLVGDVSPTGDEVKISVHFKKEVYSAYLKKMEEKTEIVNLQRFLQLWDFVFPGYVKRPHCDILGNIFTSIAFLMSYFLSIFREM